MASQLVLLLQSSRVFGLTCDETLQGASHPLAGRFTFLLCSSQARVAVFVAGRGVECSPGNDFLTPPGDTVLYCNHLLKGEYSVAARIIKVQLYRRSTVHVQYSTVDH
eukprot:GFKZ01013775.1.p1 GENE.GFKZ01013775.1~~GFKZ01013775.1.p1  ORF type:complete len:108 (-),score=1.04 GFKZ01013775.1:22-345(-)